jgi:hypothetical protein
MYITMKFIRKRIGEQVAYVNDLLMSNKPAYRRSDLIEQAQAVQKQFEFYKDLCKGKLGIEIADITFEVPDQSGWWKGYGVNAKQIPRVHPVNENDLAFPLSQTFNPKPPSYIA